MNDALDRTGMKTDKNGKNCMYWNVALDAIPGSARLVHQGHTQGGAQGARAPPSRNQLLN